MLLEHLGLAWGNFCCRDGVQARGCYLTYAIQFVHGLCDQGCNAHHQVLGITFRYTINGTLHERESKIVGEEDLMWILLYADDIALMSDDPDKLRDLVTALDSACRRWGLLISVGKTKTLTVLIPRQGEGPVAVPVIFIGTQRVEHVKQF
jgi:hypothetical protein